MYVKTWRSATLKVDEGKFNYENKEGNRR